MMWMMLLACHPAPTTATRLAVSSDPIGRLRAVSALELEGDRAFGGWSGASVERVDGQGRLWAVNDEGVWVELALREGPEGELVGIDELGRGPLKDEADQPLDAKEWADAEALVRTPDGWIVAFEHHHRLLAYGDGDARAIVGPATELPLPLGFSAPENAGIEAAARLGDDLVLLLEGEEGATGPNVGWIGHDQTWSPLTLTRTGEVRPVELATLGPDLLLVERAWSEVAGTTIRLSRLPAAALRSGREVAPIELGVLHGRSVPLDNFEAAAAEGDTIWLLSDDNFSRSQRTVLLQLRWTPPDPVVLGARVERYDLEGATERELVQSCARSCPRDDGGRAVRGLTSWSLRWTWDRSEGPGGCRLEHLGSTVDVVVQLPRWTPPTSADRELVASFPAYLDALATHEQGHVDLVTAAAREGEARLRETPCDQAHELSRQWLDELRVRQATLDLETKSGHLQGARLGPR